MQHYRNINRFIVYGVKDEGGRLWVRRTPLGNLDGMEIHYNTDHIVSISWLSFFVLQFCKVLPLETG